MGHLAGPTDVAPLELTSGCPWAAGTVGQGSAETVPRICAAGAGPITRWAGVAR
jgi:hypothetical protein